MCCTIDARSDNRPPRYRWPVAKIRVSRLAGADVVVDSSLLLVGPLLAFVLADNFYGPSGSRYLSAGIFVVALYTSIFLHECAHLLMGRAGGRQAHTVELALFGGVTLFDRPAARPGQLFATTIVGPIASIALGIGSLAVAQATTTWVGAVAWSLGVTNIFLGLFNLLPGLPLDGGQATRAIVWKLTGSQTSGLRATAWIGRGVAVLLVVVTLWRGDFSGTGMLNAVFAVVVAWTMWESATMALRSLVKGAR
jgi:Zn-dependent protease